MGIEELIKMGNVNKNETRAEGKPLGAPQHRQKKWVKEAELERKKEQLETEQTEDAWWVEGGRRQGRGDTEAVLGKALFSIPRRGIWLEGKLTVAFQVQ